MMIDPNRLKRIHVVGVKLKSDRWYVVLSNREEISWNEWITYPQDVRWNWN